MTAGSGPECLLRAAAQSPEVVIVDFVRGDSHATLVRGLASLVPNAGVIVTSDTPSEDRSVAWGTARARILPKPYTTSELVHAVEQALITG